MKRTRVMPGRPRCLFLVLLLLSAATAAPVAASSELIIDLPGLPPPVQPPAAPTPPARETPSRGPVPPPSADPYKRLANRVGQLGVVQFATPITRLPSPYVRPLTHVQPGTYVVIKAQKEGWCAVLMIDNSIGWVPGASVRLLQADVVRRGDGPMPGGEEDLDGVPSVPGFGGAVLREAFRYLGVRYRWGGNGFSGVDCSGLVKNCFAQLGVSLPRTASTQAQVGTPVAFSDLEPGDRLYFAVKGTRIDHTGIYIGDGHFIHASMSGGKVGVDKLSRPLYARSLVAARRSLPMSSQWSPFERRGPPALADVPVRMTAPKRLQ